MFQRTVKIYETALNELPKTDREVLAWSDMEPESDTGWRLWTPRRVKFNKKQQRFYDGYMHVTPKYWCFLEQLTKPT